MYLYKTQIKQQTEILANLVCWSVMTMLMLTMLIIFCPRVYNKLSCHIDSVRHLGHLRSHDIDGGHTNKLTVRVFENSILGANIAILY